MGNETRVRTGWWLALGLVTIVGVPSATWACDWDTETLLQERSRFPTALELIVGKFPRHTPDYYRWRLQDRQQKLLQNPDDDRLLDDIAVSHEKLGEYDEAIAVAKKQLERNPKRYESLANLGTFLIHDGQLAAGLPYIEQAIEVNPEAHFGREIYQVILVKYVLSRSTDEGVTLPLASERFGEDSATQSSLPFRDFLRKHLPTNELGFLSQQQIKDATTGILGMMRFSRHDSPILLEVLGELQQSQSAGQLAYRAYLSASQNVSDPVAKERYELLASRAIDWTLTSFQATQGVELSEADIAQGFAAEQADADAWFAALAKDEKDWIAAGEAVDERFNEKYRQPPEAISTDPDAAELAAANKTESFSQLRVALVAALIAMATLAVVTVFFIRQRQQSKPASHA